MKTLATTVVADVADGAMRYQAELQIKVEGFVEKIGPGAKEQEQAMKAEAEKQLKHLAWLIDCASMQAGCQIEIAQRISENKVPGGAVTQQQMDLAEKLEQEVEDAFGTGSSMFGRPVALYAVRDML